MIRLWGWGVNRRGRLKSAATTLRPSREPKASRGIGRCWLPLRGRAGSEHPAGVFRLTFSGRCGRAGAVCGLSLLEVPAGRYDQVLRGGAVSQSQGAVSQSQESEV
jgi:hypothetical protein